MSLPDRQSSQRYHVLVQDHNRIDHTLYICVAHSKAHGMSIYPHQQVVLYHQKLVVVPQQRKRVLSSQQWSCVERPSQLDSEIPPMSGKPCHVQEGCCPRQLGTGCRYLWIGISMPSIGQVLGHPPTNSFGKPNMSKQLTCFPITNYAYNFWRKYNGTSILLCMGMSKTMYHLSIQWSLMGGNGAPLNRNMRIGAL